jgi:tetratricopeptide (TPR) repeat protein
VRTELNETYSNSNEKPLTQDLVSLYKTLFYQCDFNKIINSIDEGIKDVDKISDYYKLIMIKAKAYFELNRRDMASGVLEEATDQTKLNNYAEFYYTKGSFHYFKGEFSMAKTYFKNMLDFNNDQECTYKSLLALGNIAYSEGRKEESLDYLRELFSLNNKPEPELQISFNHLKANVLIANKMDLIHAKELLEDAYQMSVSLKWTFFAQRSLYNLAKYYKNGGKVGESLGILSVLDMNLKTTDSRFLSLLVNKEFDSINHKSTQKVELDLKNKMIVIGQEDQYSLELSRWPMLFTFVELLYTKKGFISKEKIAATLWPTQKYLPRTHDPRIYDVVKRLKQKLELIEDNPLLFEANLGGYRLNIS